MFVARVTMLRGVLKIFCGGGLARWEDGGKGVYSMGWRTLVL